MTVQIEYREEAEAENLNNNKKEFLSILPPRSGYVFSFFMLFLIFLTLTLFLVKLPIKIQGTGFFVSGYKQIPVSFNKSNYLIKKVLVNKGQKLTFEQPMFVVSSAHIPGNDIIIKKLQENITHQQVLKKKKLHRQVINNALHQDIIDQHDIVMTEISLQLNNAKIYEEEELLYFKKGLSAKKEWVAKKESTQSIKITLENHRMQKLTVIQDFDNATALIDNEIELLAHAIEEDQTILRGYSDITVKSPCECIIGEMFTYENNLTEPGKVMSTLLINNPGKIAHVYIPSDQYKPITKGSLVLIKSSAYPALKYGSISGIVTSVSESTFSGKHYPELFEPTANYFKVDVNITKLPETVILQSGMEFKSEIVIQHLSLFEFIFE